MYSGGEKTKNKLSLPELTFEMGVLQKKKGMIRDFSFLKVQIKLHFFPQSSLGTPTSENSEVLYRNVICPTHFRDTV